MLFDNQTPERISEALAIYQTIADIMTDVYRLVERANNITEDFCLGIEEMGDKIARNSVEIEKKIDENEQIVSEIKNELERFLEELTPGVPPNHFDLEDLADL